MVAKRLLFNLLFKASRIDCTFGEGAARIAESVWFGNNSGLLDGGGHVFEEIDCLCILVLCVSGDGVDVDQLNRLGLLA